MGGHGCSGTGAPCCSPTLSRHTLIWPRAASAVQAVFKGWSSFKETLQRRRSGEQCHSSDYSGTDEDFGMSDNSTPRSGESGRR